MRIGVLGGTFDPIHEAHLYVAREVKAWLELDRVLLMVSRVPPHKGKSRVSDEFHRYAMAVLATSRDPDIVVSGEELMRSGPSYTIETLERLAGSSDDDFCFIAGSDALHEVHSWKECDKLFTEHCLAFVARADAPVELNSLGLNSPIRSSLKVLERAERVSLSPGRSYLLKLHPPLISSTEIRALVSRGESVPENCLDSNVYAYLKKYELYGPSNHSQAHL